jgi:predicted small lipoprotein YifL
MKKVLVIVAAVMALFAVANAENATVETNTTVETNATVK